MPSAPECINDEASGTCKTANRSNEDECLSQSEFQNLVSTFNDDQSILPLLRGTIGNVVSHTDTSTLLNSLPNKYAEASGYDENSNGRAYAAPIGYSALGLKDLQPFPEAYQILLQIREVARSTTEKSLNLCPGSLYIDFTTISQKTEGGAHRAHADNCIHFFNDGVAACDASRKHPYPSRVAASILYLNDPASGQFGGGQFYFANNTNGGEAEEGGIVEIEAGKMVYFTSGIENLHGALPVLRKDDTEPRRLALAMWYVFDEALKESLEDDPNAPTEVFSLPIPNNVELDSLLQSVGTYLVSRQNKPMVGAWIISKYGASTLHALFKDHSAMFSISFGSPKIVFERHTDANKRASLQYMLQESVLLHGVLDELLRLVSEGEFKEYNNKEFDKGLEAARAKLPARQE